MNKINSRLRFLYCQNRFLNVHLRRLLCNAMTQPFLDYACNAWYPNINKKLKMHLQAAQNKCIRFCLKLNNRSSIKSKDFEKITWLSFHERVFQGFLCIQVILLRIVLTMKYMFLQKLMEFTRVHHTKNKMFLIKKIMLDKKPYLILVPHFGTI